MFDCRSYFASSTSVEVLFLREGGERRGEGELVSSFPLHLFFVIILTLLFSYQIYQVASQCLVFLTSAGKTRLSVLFFWPLPVRRLTECRSRPQSRAFCTWVTCARRRTNPASAVMRKTRTTERNHALSPCFRVPRVFEYLTRWTWNVWILITEAVRYFAKRWRGFEIQPQVCKFALLNSVHCVDWNHLNIYGILYTNCIQCSNYHYRL